MSGQIQIATAYLPPIAVDLGGAGTGALPWWVRALRPQVRIDGTPVYTVGEAPPAEWDPVPLVVVFAGVVTVAWLVWRGLRR